MDSKVLPYYQVPQEAYTEFPKIPRWSRRIIITEKIDGTNAAVAVFAYGGIYGVYAASRTRWITPKEDNYGFARWVYEHAKELQGLGPGIHHGEWWGSGINRGYDLPKGEKRFSLLNTSKWLLEPDPALPHPDCCSVVPVLYDGMMEENSISRALAMLQFKGSVASPGYMKPEGVIIFHVQGNLFFKKTLENDEMPKSTVKS